VPRGQTDVREATGMRTLRRVLLLIGTVLVPSLGSGCTSPLPLFGMGIATPIPVPPWVTERMEDKFGPGKNDWRTSILAPIPPGYRPLCEDPPDRQQILRVMPHVTRGIPYIYEEFRDEIDFVVEKMADHIDPPRFYPLIGPAQLHHCHYKCTVYYTETIQTDYPFPVKLTRRRAEVVYIDKDHLHQVVCTPEQLAAVTRDMTDVRP
jgi:hypothetical protein